MDGEPAELSDEIGLGPEVEEHGGRTDDPASASSVKTDRFNQSSSYTS